MLAVFSCAFSAAVAASNYCLPEGILPGLGVACLIGALFTWLMRNRHHRIGLRLVCLGGALGFLWTAAYFLLVFRPAQDMDNRTVRLSAIVSEWPQETDYGYSVLVDVKATPFAELSTLLYVDEQGKDLRPGDQISTIAYCTLGTRTLAGEEITYYTAKGIFLRGEAYGELEIHRPEHIPLWYWPALW